MSLLAAELRHTRRELTRLDRRLALARLAGKVDQVRARNDDWEVRLNIGDDPASGKKVLSPWVRVQPVSAGELKIKTRPSIGQPMHLVSSSGVVGADSLAMWGPFNEDENKPPKGDEDVVIERGATRLQLKDGEFIIKVGDKASITVKGDEIVLKVDDTEHEIKAGKTNVTSKKLFTIGKAFLGAEQKDEEVAIKVVTDGGPAKQVFSKAA